MDRLCHRPWIHVCFDVTDFVCEESLTADCELEALDPHASLTKRSVPLRSDGTRRS
jgi:hypothetical protein